MTITGPKLVRVVSAGIGFVRNETSSRVLSTSWRVIARSASTRESARPAFCFVTNGFPRRRKRRESTGDRSMRVASFATYARTRTGRVTTTSFTLANGSAVFARSIAFETFGAASGVGSALNTRSPKRRGSGDSNHERIAAVASLGSSPPTGRPPTVTPSGNGCAGDGDVVVPVSAPRPAPPANANALKVPATAQAQSSDARPTRFIPEGDPGRCAGRP